jgi:Ca2+-binding EF-hand superfamily protein
MSLTNKDIKHMAEDIDTDGSGVFEFTEFVELVKVLMLKLRSAEDALETIDEMKVCV